MKEKEILNMIMVLLFIICLQLAVIAGAVCAIAKIVSE
jgi:hypothetical protein